MAVTDAFRTQPYNGVTNSMMGRRRAFSPPSLPANYGFNELAGYEESRRREQGDQFKNQIGQLRTGIQGQYDSALKNYQDTGARRRAELSSSLMDNATKTFQGQNPFILEDLNSRGLSSSPTTVASAQAEKLREIEMANQSRLLDFDQEQRQFEDTLGAQRLQSLNELDAAGTSAGIQSEQDALDAGLDLRRGELERQVGESQASREEAMARDLAKQQRKQGITESLIGLGGNLGSSYLTRGGGGGGGGLGGLFGGGARTASSSVIGGGPFPVRPAGPGMLGAGVGLLGGGYAGQTLGKGLYKKDMGNKSVSRGVKAGSAIGAGAGTLFGGPIGGIVGGAVGGAAGGAIGKLTGGKKTADGRAIADLSISVQSTQRELADLKAAVSRGEISQEEYMAEAQPIVEQTAQAVGAMAARGKKYADPINQVWQDFLNAGLARADGGRWVAA